MVDLDQDKIINMSSKKKELLSSTMKRTSEWIFSQEIPSDITINVGENSFSLHKFPLVSKCGYIKKLVSKSTVDDDVAADLSIIIEVSDIPGGANAFELAIKFCYDVKFEITASNIAMLRCAAEYLEMTEEQALGNLIEKTETYLNEVAFSSLSGAVSVLHQSEILLPFAEKVKLLSRSIDAIASIACKESQITSTPSNVVDWWAEDLTALRVDVFRRVVIAMMARGFKQYALGPILMLYAQKSLRGLDLYGKGRKKAEPRQEHEKRIILETIVSLLPREKSVMSVSFLSMLLRASIYFETSVACRLDLEKRIGLQLGQAVLDDLLIPSFSFPGDTLFDVDTVQRIVSNYLEQRELEGHFGYCIEDEYVTTSSLSDIARVGKFIENYLAEIASDRNLCVPKFVAIAELVPEQSRVNEDGMYRAIDIYLKAHPDLSEAEMKKVCSLMDCQKLSREACAHAAQNDRLPVQTVVQVLYYEQQRLQDAMNGTNPQTVSSLPTKPHPVPEDLSLLKRENDVLKMELRKMKMKLMENEKGVVKSAVNNSPLNALPVGSANKPPLPRKSFMSSVSKKLGRLNPFVWPDGMSASGVKGRSKPAKDRRHSIS